MLASQRRKFAKRNRFFAGLRAKFLQGKLCEVCQKHKATEVHHIAGRNAAASDAIFSRYENEKNWLAICGAFQNGCHELIDKQSPAVWACAAKLEQQKLDIDFLRSLRSGRRFAFTMSELEQAADDLEQWRLTL